MPRIFDNIEQSLLPALRETLQVADHADFCVGYFNLRGWKQLDSYIEKWAGGEGRCCRLLVGMQRLPQEDLHAALSLMKQETGIDNAEALRLKKKLAEEFREQLTLGIPTNEDEAGLRRLATQIKAKQVVVKLFLRHPLHAKLYLLFRPDPINPTIGYLGSSNLTLAGLSQQGELNVDVLDHDACTKLARWFEERWNDRWCQDISNELVNIIEESWAREDLIPPYHIYIKMAYHLSQEARTGLSEFRIPRDFGQKLFEFQTAAVKIAAHHLNKRGGVLIGDVVGLGKTFMATALARIFQDDYFLETLIICPKNLVPMWEEHRVQYRLNARVLSNTQFMTESHNLQRFRLVLIDESHNLRNREGKRYRAIQEYIQRNESKCILLSATPYNKTYLDLSNQLRASYAYQIWKNAITAEPGLQKIIPDLSPVSYSTRANQSSGKQPDGVLIYLRTAEGNDALAWIDKQGHAVTESQFAILQAAACAPTTPALSRQENHHGLVQKGVEIIVNEEKSVGGQLGRPSSARFRAYERLRQYAARIKGTLLESQDLLKAIDEIYLHPLRQSTVDTLNRQLRSGIADEALAKLVIALRDEDRLCLIHGEKESHEPRIICSMGLTEEK